jgi:hypothetical protein
MNLIDSGSPDCGPLEQRLQRLPRKQLKFWSDDLPAPSTCPTNTQAYCTINTQFGSLLSLPDGNTINAHNAWAYTKDLTLTASQNYTGYVVNSYNSDMNQILNLFNLSVPFSIVPKLNYLLTNINNYMAEGATVEDIQMAIWILLRRIHHFEHRSRQTILILRDVNRHGDGFVPSQPTDNVAVFLVAANNFPDTEIVIFRQLMIIPLTFEQFHPTGLPCALIEWGNYPSS